MAIHTLFQARDIRVIIEKGANNEVLNLLHETVWGTPGGIRYRKITSTETSDYFKDSWFIKLIKGEKLIGAAGMVHNRYLIDGKPLNTFYLRSFSFHPKYQVQLKKRVNGQKLPKNNLLIKKVVSRFFAEASFFQEQFPGEAILFYGYVIGNNERSARISHDFGFRAFRSFRTLIFSRKKPQKPDQLRLQPFSSLENKAAILSQIQTQYHNYPLFSLDRNTDQDHQHLWVLFEGNQPLAGLKVRKVGWQIEEIPGLSGKIMMNVFPKIPVLSRIFNPENFQFLAMDTIFYFPGYEHMLSPLIESICAEYQTNIAMLWIDEESELYQQIDQHISMGLINTLSRNTDQVNVIGRFINATTDIQDTISHSPNYISMDEVT